MHRCIDACSDPSSLRKHMKTHNGIKSNKCNQCDFASSGAELLKGTFENAQWGKAKQMRPMWFCFFLFNRFKDTFDNTQWGKAKQMQAV